MALVDVIKYEAPDDTVFVWKYPSDKIALGSQLIVNEGQQAIFVKGGQALDEFYPGTYTLTTGNIPLIDKIINLPFGGNTPFAAEIWFVNTTVKRDLKWGTPSPIPLMDPALGFPVSARAYGKWGVCVTDARSFVTQIVGSQAGAGDDKIHAYFIGEIIQNLVKVLSGVIARGEASILQISAIVDQLATNCSDGVRNEFEKFGIDLVNFNIESINIPDDELEKIQGVFAKTLEARELSKIEVGGAYGSIKSFEVLNNAAQNQSDGTVGSMLGAGIGLGAGVPLGHQLGQQLSVDDTSDKGPSGTSTPSEKIRQLKELLDEGLITPEQFEEKRSTILDSI
jgi:membrane protease subunit (stomatin/prohibitin family)